jgi:RNA polymerase sigma-70 factor (ECF subfamily)
MANNVERFEELYRLYFDRTVALLISFGFSREDARELAQDTFVRVYEGMATYRGEARWAYLKTTATRLALNKIRDIHAQKRDASLTTSADDTVVDIVDEKTPSPEALAIQRERVDRMYAAVQKLPDAIRACLLLYLAGHHYREIATTLGISGTMVKSRLHEARLHLIKLMNEDVKGIEWPP